MKTINLVNPKIWSNLTVCLLCASATDWDQRCEHGICVDCVYNGEHIHAVYVQYNNEHVHKGDSR